VPFYDFYVCNDIVVEPSSENHSSPASLKMMLETSRCAIIKAGAGLGKSLFMRHLLLEATEQYDKLKLLPILVPLREMTESLHEQILSVINGFPNVNVTTEQLEAKLASGECLLLFDGLDEMDEIKKDDFRRELTRMTNKFPSNCFYVSSRPDSDFISYEEFLVIELLSFTPKQAVDLVDKLDLGTEIKSGFLRKIKGSCFLMKHKEFIENPLLLTIMLNVFKESDEATLSFHREANDLLFMLAQPDAPYHFYDDVFDMLLKRHDANKENRREYKTRLSKTEFIEHLSVFCYILYTKEKTTFTESYFRECFIENISNKIDFDDFLYDISHNLCIITPEGREYHFIHLSFQEYFAAYRISRCDEQLAKFSKFFEAGEHHGILTMLYGLNAEKIESIIFKPYLEKLVANGYRGFLMELLDDVSWTSGFSESRGLSSDPRLALYTFIVSKLETPAIRIGKEGDGVEIFRGRSDTIKVVGYRHRAYLDELFDSANKEKYSEILKMMEDDDFIWKVEYNAIRKFLGCDDAKFGKHRRSTGRKK